MIYRKLIKSMATWVDGVCEHGGAASDCLLLGMWMWMWLWLLPLSLKHFISHPRTLTLTTTAKRPTDTNTDTDTAAEILRLCVGDCWAQHARISLNTRESCKWLSATPNAIPIAIPNATSSTPRRPPTCCILCRLATAGDSRLRTFLLKTIEKHLCNG